MVLVMGTSSCHMMNSRVEAWHGPRGRRAPTDPSRFLCYETGQASVGTLRVLVDDVRLSHQTLNEQAKDFRRAVMRVMASTGSNGCRTRDGWPIRADSSERRSDIAAQLNYRALMEATRSARGSSTR
jgi:ribulose kinase